MKTILVCNQKGGVGKSLVADEIAFSFERSGIPVSFYDLDAQGGTLHRTQEADGAQVAVVDTPGALQEALSEWLREADVVVIPTRTTSRDIEPLMRMRKAVFKHSRAKIVYVMNGWNRFKASRDFMEWFEGLAGDQTVVTLPQSEAFVQAFVQACPWSSSTAGARPRGRRAPWWTRCARLRGSRGNNRRSGALFVWTNRCSVLYNCTNA